MPQSTILLLLAWFCHFSLSVSASPESIWHVSIFDGPALPPGKGSPLQASALRNKAYLPAQIAGIVAAYVVSILVIGSALLFVGRRLRRAAQGSPTTLAMEMVKPVKPNVPRAFDPSPISPATSKQLYGPSPADTVDTKNLWPSPIDPATMKNNWPSPDKSKRESSGWGSMKKGHTKRQPSYQSSVVTFDESVIEEDKERNEREMERLYAAVVQHDERRAESVTELPDHRHTQHPPELQHLRDTKPMMQPPAKTGANSPTRVPTKSPRSTQRPTPISIHSRNSSRSSFGSFTKKRGVRSLPISPPMGSPDLVPESAYDDAEPLTPRMYNDPGPPPPTPPQRKTQAAREERLSPRDAKFPDHPLRTPRMSGPTVPIIQEPIPETQPVGWPSPNNSKQSLARDPNKPRRTPAPLALRTAAANNASTASSINSTIRTAPLPLRNPYPTNYNSDRQETIKATVIETKARNQHLRTPQTGVPMTPYSPYMPYTPLTPMTPSRLVTREERKRREKEEGRRVITEEDAVVEEADTWADV